ncbi:MAG: hypothetical protein AB7H66_10615 [Hyphomonadaceae bacterium]
MDARPAASDPSRFATLEDVRHVLGEVEDTVIAEILSVRPTCRDLSEAAIWAHGDSDLVVRERGELTAGALAVAEILVRHEDTVLDDPGQA